MFEHFKQPGCSTVQRTELAKQQDGHHTVNLYQIVGRLY